MKKLIKKYQKLEREIGLLGRTLSGIPSKFDEAANELESKIRMLKAKQDVIYDKLDTLLIKEFNMEKTNELPMV